MKLKEKIRILKIKTARNPTDLCAYISLGSNLLSANRVREAKEIFEYALCLQPNNQEILVSYGVSLQMLGENQKATQQFWRALDINPNNEAAHSNLGCILNLLGDTKGALHHCKKALALNSDNANTLNNHGVLLHQLERMNEAILALIKATKLRPDSPITFRNLGLSFQAIGRIKEARAAYRHAISLAPRKGITYRYVSEITTYTKYTREAKMMTEALSKAEKGSECAKNLHFALGKVFDDLKEHKKAIYHFLMGNKLHRRDIDYSPERSQKLIDRILNVFQPGIQLPEIKTTKSLIFIVGMPGAGSTLIEQILSSHSEVYATSENRNFFNNMAKLVRLLSSEGMEYPEGVSSFTKKELTGLGSSYLNAIKNLSKKKFFSDKTTESFLYIGLIFMAFPNARIVHVVRNPADTCFSCFSKYFSDAHHFSYDLKELGQYYRDYQRVMEHWHRVFPEKILDIHYERIVTQQEEETRKLLEYCGLESEDSCLNFHETDRAILSPSANQVRTPLYGSAIERSKNYERYLEPLLKELEA